MTMIRTFNSNRTFTGSFTAEYINPEMFSLLLGRDFSTQNDFWDVSYYKLIQNRTHRKRRINKKWAKRYGFRRELVDIGSFKAEKNRAGIVMFTKNTGKDSLSRIQPNCKN